MCDTIFPFYFASTHAALVCAPCTDFVMNPVHCVLMNYSNMFPITALFTYISDS